MRACLFKGPKKLDVMKIKVVSLINAAVNNKTYLLIKSNCNCNSNCNSTNAFRKIFGSLRALEQYSRGCGFMMCTRDLKNTVGTPEKGGDPRNSFFFDLLVGVSKHNKTT